jgi:phosphopantothenoylcysteine decarboxylase/phosphopantothenate--cysteine ligase
VSSARPAPTVGRLGGRLIAVGVTGSIAAYKAVELVRLLRGEGAEVVVLLTPSAARFVAPLTLAALSGHPVEGDVLALQPDGRIGHIVVADSADAIVVAPATAHWLGAMANGLAADAVTATCLATSSPVVVAPAMDGEMYAHPASQGNVRRLRDDFGYAVVEPESGPLASGQVGVGRLADLGRIVDAVVAAIGDRPVRQPDPAARPPRLPVEPRGDDLAGRHLVVTAGGTAEPIDPVRSITNRSTGKMGVAIAQAALDRGAAVTLIVGQVSVPLPDGARVVRAETTAAMRDAVLEAALGVARPAAVADAAAPFGHPTAIPGPDGLARIGPPADVLVMAAAVADFRPVAKAATKLARGGDLTLELEPTEDILAEVGERARSTAPRPILVGFAAETGSLDRAADKLTRKGVDLLVANDVAEPGSGFGTDTNRVTLLARRGAAASWPLLSKREVAERLLDRVATLLDERDAAAQTGATREESKG